MRTNPTPSFFFVLVASTSVPAQETWWYNRNDGAPSRRAAMGCAYDAARNEVILFGGLGHEPALADTWRWNGVAWQLLRPAHHPSPRYAFAMAYDATRARIVLFGGFEDPRYPNLGDTWEWDGTDWTQRSPATSPPARRGAAMAHDPVRGRTVLFGGADQNGRMQDTWEWDGVTWTRRTPATVPSSREGHGMAFFPGRNRVVMALGATSPSSNETWEWDGVDWLFSPAVFPPGARTDHGLAYSPAHGRVLLFGGTNSLGTVVYRDLWAFSGTNWTQLATVNTPLQRCRHAFSQGPGQTCVVHGGTADFQNLLPDTWTMSPGNAFTVYVPPARWPSARYLHGLSYDARSQGILLFGGTSDTTQAAAASNQTWLRDGSGWRQLSPALTPQPRMGHAMATDFQRDRVVMFSGADSLTGVLRDDTWEWDGTTWRQLLPVSRPPGRLYAVLAYDAARDRTWLFGGYRAPSWLSDTWSWDGTTWTQHSPATAPALVGLNGVYDALNGKVVVFGRSAAGLAQTWIWDGTSWTLRPTPAALVGRGGHAMAYDPIRGRAILNGGGWSGLGKLRDTWEWDGTTWTQPVFPGAEEPPAREWHRMAFDHARGMTFAFGGNLDSGPSIATHAYFAPQGSYYAASHPSQTQTPSVRQTVIGGPFEVTYAAPAGAFGALLLMARTPALVPSLTLDPPLMCNASQLHLLPDFVLSMDGTPPRLQFPIPWDRTLQGLGLLLQVLYVAPGNCVGLSAAKAVVLWDM